MRTFPSGWIPDTHPTVLRKLRELNAELEDLKARVSRLEQNNVGNTKVG